MKTRNKLILMLLMGTLGVSMLSGCGSSTPANETAVQSAAPEAAAGSEASAESAVSAETESSAASETGSSSAEEEKTDEEQLTEMATFSDDTDYRDAIVKGATESLKEDKELQDIAEKADIDLEEYAKALTSHFEIKTQEPVIKGDKGTVDVKLVMPDYTKMDSFMEKKMDKFMEEIDTSKLSEDELYKKFGKLMMEIAADPDLPTTSETFSMDFTKTNGEWKADDDYVQMIIDAFDAGQS